jgi:hypothetical protein
MGGIGKSALAFKLAEHLTSHYSDGQLYLDLEGVNTEPKSVAEAMKHIIHAYHPTAEIPENQAELTGLYQSVLYGKRGLLLLDNAASAEQVEPLIPPSSWFLLVTSRQHFVVPGLFTMRLGTLPPDEAQEPALLR